MSDEPVSTGAAAPEHAESPSGGQRLVRLERGKGRQRYHTPDDEIPSEIRDPAKRDLPTIGRIELTDLPDPFDVGSEVSEDGEVKPPEITDTSDGRLRTLEDLNYAFPFDDGSGEYFVTVVRKQPRVSNGVSTIGRQADIRGIRLSYEEFVDVYGGGQYELTVYGPPKHGRQMNPRTGRPVPKALTKPIMLTVPWYGSGGIEPNPDSAHGLEGPDSMQPSNGGAPGVVGSLMSSRTRTPADARIFERQMEHQEKMDEREQIRRQQAEERSSRRSYDTTQLLKELAAQQNATLHEELRELRRQLEQERQRPQPNPVEAAARILEVSRPTESQLSSVRDQYERQISMLTDQHKRELDLVTQRASEERHRGDERAQKAIEDVTRRAEDEIKRAHDRMTALEERTDRERSAERVQTERDREREQAEFRRQLEHQEKESARQLEHAERESERRIQAVKDSYERDRTMLGDLKRSEVAVEKATLEARIEMLQLEVQRLRDQLAQAEKKGDLGRQLRTISEQAELLGFKKDEGGGEAAAEPEDWKQMLGKIGLNLIQKLPEIISNAGTAAAQARGGGQAHQSRTQPSRRMQAGPPAAAPGPAQIGGQQALPGFWTEDSGVLPPSLPEAYQQMPSPYAPVEAPSMAIAAAPQQQPPPQQQPQAQGAPPVQPQPSAPVQSHAPPAPPPPVPQAVSDEQLLEYRSNLELAFVNNVPAESIAQDLSQRMPREVLHAIANAIDPVRYAAVLRAHKLGSSPLVRRDGQRFLSRIKDAILAL